MISFCREYLSQNPIAMRKLVLFFLISCMGFFSCEFQEGTSQKLKFINIENADYLAIRTAKSSQKSNASTARNNLFKGTVSENECIFSPVSFIDDEGNSIDPEFTIIEVENICNISEDYICLKGHFEINREQYGDNQIFSSLLIRKSDGSVYDFNGHFPGNKSFYLHSKYLQRDLNNNHYYSHSSAIYRFGTADNLTQETYVSNSQYVGGDFFIDHVGDCYFFGNGTKIKLKDGGIIYDEKYIHDFIKTSSNKTYAIVTNSLSRKFYELKIIEGELILSHVSDVSNYFRSGVYSYRNMNRNDYYLIDSVFSNYSGNIYFGVIFNENLNELYYLALPRGLDTELYFFDKVNENYLWLNRSGSVKKEFYKINIDNYTIEEYGGSIKIARISDYQKVDFPGYIEIYDYEIEEDDNIYFTGYNLTTEEDISGLYNAEGDLIITDNTSDYYYSVLKKIN